MHSGNRTIAWAIAVGLLLCFAAVSASEQVKTSLFQNATEALQAARAAQADLLSPKNYAKAMKHYRSAEEKYRRGRNLEAIRAELKLATTSFAKAAKASKRAQTELAALIKTRADAQKAESARYAKELWLRAEDRFKKAMVDFERGAAAPAKRRAAEAESIYRNAELKAIKDTYLTETRNLLARAQKMKVAKYAPKTLKKAETLLLQAEKALNDNRYDSDLPRSLAQRAKYEANHAVYLARLVMRAREKRLTIEDIILDWETPVIEIAAAADMQASLDKGYKEPVQKIITYIEDQQSRSQKLEQNADYLQAEVKQLQRMLGGASKERVALSGRLEAQAQVRQQFAKVEKMFTRSEARVLREHTEVIIRLIGLSFAVGRSSIDAKNYRLLTKVQHAIRAFPNSQLIIEGHTDSHGSDAANYVLSQKRAESVKHYLIANMRIDPSRIKAVGYGETRPVANNETRSGRAKNRRIDIVITPSLSGVRMTRARGG
ncbi:MAG: OmpA family protein [Acidiferrobacterales bacterium]